MTQRTNKTIIYLCIEFNIPVFYVQCIKIRKKTHVILIPVLCTILTEEK